jgi:hypothetical protein
MGPSTKSIPAPSQRAVLKKYRPPYLASSLIVSDIARNWLAGDKSNWQ